MKWARRSRSAVDEVPEAGHRWEAPASAVDGVRIGLTLDGRVPSGDPATAWDRRRAEYKLVSPLNAKKFTVVVVGTGLAGSGAAAALG